MLPSIGNRYNPSFVVSYSLENRLGEIKMVAGWIAPAAGIIGKSVVGRAEVGGGDNDGARQAPLGIVHAPHLETRTAG